MGVGIANVTSLAYGVDYVDTIESKVGTWWWFWLIEFFSFYWVKLYVSVLKSLKQRLGESLRSLKEPPSSFQWFLGVSRHQIYWGVGSIFAVQVPGFDSQRLGPTGLGWLSRIFTFNKCPGDSVADSHLKSADLSSVLLSYFLSFPVPVFWCFPEGKVFQKVRISFNFNDFVLVVGRFHHRTHHFPDFFPYL